MQINTNMASLFAQRSSSGHQSHLSKTMQRLSSGVRINSAADDVAGVAIADRMTARIRSLNQVHRNANDGVSLLQTADSALGGIGDVLQRIREIAVQAANAPYSGTDRGSMQHEVNQLLQEVNRIAVDTRFNGKTLMDGSGSLMGGNDADEQYAIMGLRGAWLRESEQRVEEQYGLKGKGGPFKIILDQVGDGVGGTTASITPNSGTMELRVDMNDFTGPSKLGNDSADRTIAHEMVHAVMADNMSLGALPWWFIEGTAEFIHGADDRVKADFTTAAAMVGAMPTTQPNTSLEYSSSYLAVRFLHEQASGGIKEIMNHLKKGATFDQALNATTQIANTAAFESAYKGAAGQSYVQGLYDGGYFDNADTGAIGGADADGGLVLDEASIIPDTGGYSYNPLATYEEIWPDGFDRTGSYNSFDLQVGENKGDRLTVSIGATTVAALGLLGISVAKDPNSVMDRVDLALTYLNEQRGAVGAASNRLEHLINVNSINVETTSDARSRILDADFAQETSELARRKILQQASQGMLAQANAQSRQVLDLLAG